MLRPITSSTTQWHLNLRVMATYSSEPGGFLPDALPSPVPSNNSVLPSSLPHPRSQPLRAGSSKEETTRRYVEGRLLHVSRRYTKKFQPPEPGDEVTGYQNICDACKDLGDVVDVLWLSATRIDSHTAVLISAWHIANTSCVQQVYKYHTF
jgi:hypothetical protein